MSREKYVVQLTDDARESLQKFVRGGTSSVREVARARILLKADDGWTVHRIAEALDVYHEPHDPKQPVVCFDESSTQLLADVREPTAARPGQPERYDTEYRRQGTRNLFMFIEPLAGYRHVAITQRRTRQDFAHQMKWLVDEAYPEADTVRVVLDNLNTHRLGSLYVAFVPDEARLIARRLRFHYTPKHGSWLNMAEIELSVFLTRLS